MKKQHLYYIIGAILVLAAAVILRTTKSNEGTSNVAMKEQEALARPAPDFALKDYDGNTVTLQNLKGKPMVLNSWAAWCPFCVEEMSDFAAVQQEVGEQAVFIAINRAESRQTAKEFSDAYQVTDKLLILLDPNDSFYQSIGGFTMPETLFVDKNGNIIEHIRGPMRLDTIRQKTNNLIQAL